MMDSDNKTAKKKKKLTPNQFFILRQGNLFNYALYIYNVHILVASIHMVHSWIGVEDCIS